MKYLVKALWMFTVIGLNESDVDLVENQRMLNLFKHEYETDVIQKNWEYYEPSYKVYVT